jgi:hypothetical protein
MRQALVTQYVIAGESYGFPGDPLVFDNEARAAVAEALLERAKPSGLLGLGCSPLGKLGRGSSNHMGCNRANGHDSPSAAVGRLLESEGNLHALKDTGPGVQLTMGVIRAGKTRDMHTMRWRMHCWKHCWVVGGCLIRTGQFRDQEGA